MNSDRVVKIESYPEAAERTRREWYSLGMRNVANLTPEERIQSAKEYALAEARMNEAESLLRAAISFP